ncbi:hypothetical protein [Nocardia vulneris]|uniref:Uncharacterized protein n=1 Tax=Nocardia vulneris TaxID=1141657 RepID=A0ABR4ZCR7_9NOCA|nr:hypothetical protein [Nocardia vulneris]KIA63061.1 hypothetical protein FG87_22180 [Nocardia vulneris]
MPEDTPAQNEGPADQPGTEPDQLSFDAELIDYWRGITSRFPAMNDEHFAAVAAIVRKIDERRAA